ncbi:MAG TPA: DUF1735 domain-containing protein [Mucilaginibacter sp.]|nr:DUF1735 domain-containing protein [Mucilaginibacter sp.]
MKKRLYFLISSLALMLTTSLTSCLKDPRYVNYGQQSNIINFPLGGLGNFGNDAITETPDTDAKGTIVRQFSVDLASVSAPSSNTSVTLAIDTTLVAKYNATESAVFYVPVPANAYSFTSTNVTIPSGKHVAIVSVTFYKNLLDPSKSYMLPIKIVSASKGTISSNLGIHWYHFIGNDFAGAYDWHYWRWNSTDTTTAPTNNATDLGDITALPVTPTEFQVTTAYYTQPSYHVTFTKTGTGSSATYSNFQVAFNPDEIATDFTAASISVTVQPHFISSYSPSKQYTYAEALTLFKFEYSVFNGTANRTIIDQYTKPAE